MLSIETDAPEQSRPVSVLFVVEAATLRTVDVIHPDVRDPTVTTIAMSIMDARSGDIPIILSHGSISYKLFFFGRYPRLFICISTKSLDDLSVNMTSYCCPDSALTNAFMDELARFDPCRDICV